MHVLQRRLELRCGQPSPQSEFNPAMSSCKVQAPCSEQTQNPEMNLPPCCCSTSSWWESSKKRNLVGRVVAEPLLPTRLRSCIESFQIPPTNRSQFPVINGNIIVFEGSHFFPRAWSLIFVIAQMLTPKRSALVPIRISRKCVTRAQSKENTGALASALGFCPDSSQFKFHFST